MKYSMPSATSVRKRGPEQDKMTRFILDSEKSLTFGKWPKVSMESQ
jgi:hypothetical protein